MTLKKCLMGLCVDFSGMGDFMCESLESFDGFQGVHTLHGSLAIQKSLQHLHGLESLTSIDGGVTILSADRLLSPHLCYIPVPHLGSIGAL